MNKYIRYILLILATITFANYSVAAKDVSLSWDHPGDCQVFRIYRGYTSGDWPELVGTVACPTTEFTDTDVPNGELQWVVTAVYETVPSNATVYAYYYAVTKYEYGTDSLILYKGENTNPAASDSDMDWQITKYYYTENMMISEIRVRQTSWEYRAIGW
jgi:hypothetical protein